MSLVHLNMKVRCEIVRGSQMNENLKFTRSRKQIFILLAGIISFIMVIIIISLIKNDTSTAKKVMLFLVVIITLILMMLREKLTFFGDFISYRYWLKTRDTYYDDIYEVLIESRDSKNKSYFIFYDADNEEIMKIPSNLLSSIEKQYIFLSSLRNKNEQIYFDEACEAVLNIEKNNIAALNVMGKNIKMVVYIVVGVIAGAFIFIPFILIILVSLFEK